MKLKIKKGDSVVVISGSDKGKKGDVLTVVPHAMKIKVQGVKVMTHFDKKDGLKTIEGFIPYSKVKLVEKAVAKETMAKKKTEKKKSSAKRA